MLTKQVSDTLSSREDASSALTCPLPTLLLIAILQIRGINSGDKIRPLKLCGCVVVWGFLLLLFFALF